MFGLLMADPPKRPVTLPAFWSSPGFCSGGGATATGAMGCFSPGSCFSATGPCLICFCISLDDLLLLLDGFLLPVQRLLHGANPGFQVIAESRSRQADCKHAHKKNDSSSA